MSVRVEAAGGREAGRPQEGVDHEYSSLVWRLTLPIMHYIDGESFSLPSELAAGLRKYGARLLLDVLKEVSEKKEIREGKKVGVGDLLRTFRDRVAENKSVEESLSIGGRALEKVAELARYLREHGYAEMHLALTRDGIEFLSLSSDRVYALIGEVPEREGYRPPPREVILRVDIELLLKALEGASQPLELVVRNGDVLLAGRGGGAPARYVGERDRLRSPRKFLEEITAERDKVVEVRLKPEFLRGVKRIISGKGKYGAWTLRLVVAKEGGKPAIYIVDESYDSYAQRVPESLILSYHVGSSVQDGAVGMYTLAPVKYLETGEVVLMVRQGGNCALLTRGGGEALGALIAPALKPYLPTQLEARYELHGGEWVAAVLREMLRRAVERPADRLYTFRHGLYLLRGGRKVYMAGLAGRALYLAELEAAGAAERDPAPPPVLRIYPNITTSRFNGTMGALKDWGLRPYVEVGSTAVSVAGHIIHAERLDEQEKGVLKEALRFLIDAEKNSVRIPLSPSDYAELVSRLSPRGVNTLRVVVEPDGSAKLELAVSEQGEERVVWSRSLRASNPPPQQVQVEAELHPGGMPFASFLRGAWRAALPRAPLKVELLAGAGRAPVFKLQGGGAVLYAAVT
jgi:hypothetical protein